MAFRNGTRHGGQAPAVPYRESKLQRHDKWTEESESQVSGRIGLSPKAAQVSAAPSLEARRVKR